MRKIFFVTLLIFAYSSLLQSQSFNASLMGSFYTSTRAFDVKVDGRFAYVVGWEQDFYGNYFGSFSIIDILFPTAPNLISSIYINDAYGVDVRGNYAYIAESNNLLIIDISKPSMPQIIGQKSLPSSAKDVKVIGNIAYIADEYAGLRVLDVSNPENPTEIGHLDLPGRAFDVEIKDSLAYLADHTGGLFCISINNPTKPKVINEFPASDAIIDIDLQDTLAYFTDGYSGIKVINISEPHNFFLVDELYMPYWCLGIKVLDNYAYVAAWEFGGLRIVDVSNPLNMIEVGYYNTIGYSRDVDVVGSLAFLADWNGGGLEIINNNLLNPLHIDDKLGTPPQDFKLIQNYPNPFNPSTTIEYQIAKARVVSLKVYDLIGKEVATLVNEEKPAGTYEVNFNGSNLPSGVYIYKLQAGEFVQTKKMILLK